MVLGQYIAILAGTWYYWVSIGSFCLSISIYINNKKVELLFAVNDPDSQILQDRATQLLRSRSALCAFCKVYFSAQPNKLRPILKLKKYYTKRTRQFDYDAVSNTWDTKYVTVSNTWAIKDTVTSYFTKYTLCIVGARNHYCYSFSWIRYLIFFLQNYLFLDEIIIVALQNHLYLHKIMIITLYNQLYLYEIIIIALQNRLYLPKIMIITLS